MAGATGARIAIAEDRYLGGTCVNVGCIPKKLFVYAAHYDEDFGDAAAYGWTVAGERFDWPVLLANKDKEIARLNGLYERLQGVQRIYHSQCMTTLMTYKLIYGPESSLILGSVEAGGDMKGAFRFQWHCLRPMAFLLPLVTAVGCTFDAPVTPPPTPVIAAQERLPIAVGVYYSPEFLAYTHRQSYGSGPHSVVFDVGESSATHFSRVFNAYFQRALRFPDRPAAARPAADVDAVLIPEIEQVTMTDPSLYGWAGTWRTELVYRFHFVDPAGLPIANWTVHGAGAKGGVDWVGPKIPGEAFAAALEAAGQDFVDGFTRVPEVNRWLSVRGIQVSQRGSLAPKSLRLGVPTAS